MNKDEVIRVLKSIYDPELPVNIYDLGLIYDINIINESKLEITMTLTSPNCPVAEALPQEIATTVGQELGFKKVGITLTFDPPWTKDKMTENGMAILTTMGFM